MAYSTAYTAAVDQLLDEPGLIGPTAEARFGYKFTAATISATSLTTVDPELVRLGANYVDNRLQGYHLYLGTNGQERIITSMSVSTHTATINFIGVGSATVVASDSTCYLTKLMSWTQLRAAFNDCLEYIPVEGFIPLAHGPADYDLQDSDTVDTSWTEASATDTVQTTASEVWMGARSLVVTDSGAGGGYTASGNVRMDFSEKGAAYAIVKADTGTCALRVTDESGNTLNTVEFTGEDWFLVRNQFTLASDDRGAALRLMGTSASAVGDWTFAWIVRDSSKVFRLPATLDERFKVKGIARGIFGTNGSSLNTWLADDVYFDRLRGEEYGDDREFRFVARQADANPHMIVLENGTRSDEPLFIIVQFNYANPYGVSAIFTGASSILADASTTTCPPHLLTARVKQWIGAQYPDAYPGLEQRGAAEYKQRSAGRRPAMPSVPSRVYSLFSRR